MAKLRVQELRLIDYYGDVESRFRVVNQFYNHVDIWVVQNIFCMKREMIHAHRSRFLPVFHTYFLIAGLHGGCFVQHLVQSIANAAKAEQAYI